MSEIRTGVHLGHLLVDALARHRNSDVLELGETTLTGQQMADQISQYVQALDSFGAGKGAAVGLLALNRPEVLLVIGAGQAAGCRRTALHPLGSLDDHAYVLADAGVDTLVIDPNPMFVQRAKDLQEKVPSLTKILTLGPAEIGEDLAAKAASFAPDKLQATDLDPDHIVSITYTGGTTGKPKGVIGTASSIVAMTQVQLAEWEWPEAPRFLMCTPLSHAGAAFFVPTLMKGGSMVVLPKFDPGEVLATIEREKITATMLVPAMLYALMDHPDSKTRDLSSLQTIYYGASAINPVRLAEAIERFGPIFAQYYGQSECPMVISYLAKAEHQPEHLSSCGRPSRWLRTALLNDAGEEVAVGEPGEICVAGPVLAAGYWNLPDATAETFSDGWLRTGDVAKADADGFWYIVDRTKDMIVTGGFNVFPKEVEDVIAEHPAVAQVAVVGTPDEKWGEAVTALIVLRPDASEEGVASAVQTLVKDRKGAVQSPKQVLFVEAIPMTGLGKPDKKVIRAQFWEGQERTVG